MGVRAVCRRRLQAPVMRTMPNADVVVRAWVTNDRFNIFDPRPTTYHDENGQIASGAKRSSLKPIPIRP